MSYLLIFLLLSLLIFVHELGHLIAAKACAIPLTRFSIGFGRRLWGVQIGETDYCISLLPFGGYVQPALDAEAFQHLPWHRQVIFALGGPLANGITALVGLFVFYATQGTISIEGALFFSAMQTGTTMMEMLYALPTLFRQPEELSGIVGIIEQGGDYLSANPGQTLTVFVLLNLNLAVFNLLPMLPLDGGRIIMAILQRIYRPFWRLQTPFALAGWAMLFALMIYVTMMDIYRLA